MDSIVMDIIETQLAEVQRRYPDAGLVQTSDGQRVLVVPDVALQAGWSAANATIRVIVPAGFPHVKPDCFFTDAVLRLSNGGEPASTSLQAVFGGQYRWFSWHLATWDPTTGSLDQYVHFCRQRMREAR